MRKPATILTLLIILGFSETLLLANEKDSNTEIIGFYIDAKHLAPTKPTYDGKPNYGEVEWNLYRVVAYSKEMHIKTESLGHNVVSLSNPFIVEIKKNETLTLDEYLGDAPRHQYFPSVLGDIGYEIDNCCRTADELEGVLPDNQGLIACLDCGIFSLEIFGKSDFSKAFDKVVQLPRAIKMYNGLISLGILDGEILTSEDFNIQKMMATSIPVPGVDNATSPLIKKLGGIKESLTMMFYPLLLHDERLAESMFRTVRTSNNPQLPRLLFERNNKKQKVTQARFALFLTYISINKKLRATPPTPELTEWFAQVSDAFLNNFVFDLKVYSLEEEKVEIPIWSTLTTESASLPVRMVPEIAAVRYCDYIGGDNLHGNFDGQFFVEGFSCD